MEGEHEKNKPLQARPNKGVLTGQSGYRACHTRAVSGSKDSVRAGHMRHRTRGQHSVRRGSLSERQTLPVYHFLSLGDRGGTYDSSDYCSEADLIWR